MDKVVLLKTALDANVSDNADTQQQQITFFDQNLSEQFRAYYISKASSTASYYKTVNDDNETNVPASDVVRVNLDDNSNSGQITYFDQNLTEQFRAYYISKASTTASYYQIVTAEPEPEPEAEPEPEVETEVPASGVYSLKLEDNKMYLRVNDTSNTNYARIGQLIFNLEDSNGSAITNGVTLSGSFTDTTYQSPDYNSLITNNWSVTKKVATVTPVLTANTWTEVLSVPSNAATIKIDTNYDSFFGTKTTEMYYVIGSNVIDGSDIAPFSNPGVSLSDIQIINS